MQTFHRRRSRAFARKCGRQHSFTAQRTFTTSRDPNSATLRILWTMSASNGSAMRCCSWKKTSPDRVSHRCKSRLTDNDCRYSIVANYLFRTYPKLRVSYLSAIRQRIVQNTTLAKFATMYKMDQALELGEGFERMRNDAKSESTHLIRTSPITPFAACLMMLCDFKLGRILLKLSLARSPKCTVTTS